MFGGDSAVVGELAGLLPALAELPSAADDGERIDRIRLLEQLRGAVAAAQARETAAFAASRRAEHAARRTRAQHVERDIAGQVGLARRISPHAARRYVGFAGILTSELPATFAVLARGDTSEWRAMLIARNTIFLSRDHRAEVDRSIAGQLPALGDKRVDAVSREHAYRLDPQGFVDRANAAEGDRRVSLRPAPEVMARLSALLPLTQAVAVYAALGKAADAARAAGDPRSRGQLMADLLTDRILGRISTELAVEIELIMTDQTLLTPDRTPDSDAGDAAATADVAEAGDPGACEAGEADVPAWLVGYGPLPARYARHLVLHAPDSAPRWIRRLFRHPTTSELAAMESRRRLFTPAQRRFVRLRDQYCRNPWCEAPIRHTDHVRPHATGGPTDVRAAQGACENCNQTKQAPGWHARTRPDGTIETTTPTGHHYLSLLPRPPSSRPEQRLAQLIDQQPRAA